MRLTPVLALATCNYQQYTILLNKSTIHVNYCDDVHDKCSFAPSISGGRSLCWSSIRQFCSSGRLYTRPGRFSPPQGSLALDTGSSSSDWLNGQNKSCVCVCVCECECVCERERELCTNYQLLLKQDLLKKIEYTYLRKNGLLIVTCCSCCFWALLPVVVFVGPPCL